MSREISAVAAPADMRALENLFQFYLHDFSEYTASDVEVDGRYSTEPYWTDNRFAPFLVRVDGMLAGFAIVRHGSMLTDARDVVTMDEFFVMRKYRRHGTGAFLATAMFDRFPGAWEVCEMRDNVPAQAFWRRVIGRYTGGKFKERTWDDDHWRGPVQFFDNRLLG